MYPNPVSNSPPHHSAPLLPQSEDKSLRLINHMWHIIVREPGNEQINEAIADWLLERAA